MFLNNKLNLLVILAFTNMYKDAMKSSMKFASDYASMLTLYLLKIRKFCSKCGTNSFGLLSIGKFPKGKESILIAFDHIWKGLHSDRNFVNLVNSLL